MVSRSGVLIILDVYKSHNGVILSKETFQCRVQESLMFWREIARVSAKVILRNRHNQFGFDAGHVGDGFESQFALNNGTLGWVWAFEAPSVLAPIQAGVLPNGLISNRGVDKLTLASSGDEKILHLEGGASGFDTRKR